MGRRPTGKSFLRTPHGAAKERGAPGPRLELPPVDELSEPLPDRMPAGAGVPRAPGGKFAAENEDSRKGGLAKRGLVTYAATLGIALAHIEKAPEAFQLHMRRASSYRKARTAELVLLTGGEGIGPGVKALVGDEALMRGGGKFLYELAAIETDKDTQLKLFQRAESLFGSARHSQIAAHELAVREAKVRRDNQPGCRDPLRAGGGGGNGHSSGKRTQNDDADGRRELPPREIIESTADAPAVTVERS